MAGIWFWIERIVEIAHHWDNIFAAIRGDSNRH